VSVRLDEVDAVEEVVIEPAGLERVTSDRSEVGK
jgi:hypothetical protein